MARWFELVGRRTDGMALAELILACAGSAEHVPGREPEMRLLQQMRARAQADPVSPRVGKPRDSPDLTDAITYVVDDRATFRGASPRLGGENAWHNMHMISYGAALAKLRPVMEELFDSFVEAAEGAVTYHVDRGLSRRDDEHFYSAVIRRLVLQDLKVKGLYLSREEDDRPRNPMSSIQIPYNGLVVWVFKALKIRDKDPQHQVPLPGSSTRKQAFWRQEPVLDLTGMPMDNLLLLWSEEQGEINPTMTLVRPLGGDHRRDNLKTHWIGPLRRDMAALAVEDLNEMQASIENPMLGGEDVG
jgi:hypothetical protein